MLDELRNKLLEYIRDNNPDVLFQLEQEAGLTQYLNQKLNDVADLIVPWNCGPASVTPRWSG